MMSTYSLFLVDIKICFNYVSFCNRFFWPACLLTLVLVLAYQYLCAQTLIHGMTTSPSIERGEKKMHALLLSIHEDAK
jgi:hypothetical protein